MLMEVDGDSPLGTGWSWAVQLYRCESPCWDSGTCTLALVSLMPWEVTVKPFLGREGDSFSCICILMFLDKLTDNKTLVWLVCCAFWLWLFFHGSEAAPLGQRPCINNWNSGVALTAVLYFCGYSVAPSVAFNCLDFQLVILLFVNYFLLIFFLVYYLLNKALGFVMTFLKWCI